MVDPAHKEHDEGFSAEWLALREPADHAARSPTLTAQLANWAKSISKLQVLELGTGTGSNLRYLCPHLGHGQQWTLLDNDKNLLEHLSTALQSWSHDNNIKMTFRNGTIKLFAKDFSAQINYRCEDLQQALETLPFDSAHLVSASALLDLTSETWLQRLADLCIKHHCASLFVLNYNGHTQWQPALADDALLGELLNEHQRRDKGFGAALGPFAGDAFAQLLHGHQQVFTELSDWQIDNHQQELQSTLMHGWLEAAMELDNNNRAQRLNQWRDHRRQQIEAGISTLRVGHIDILALPLINKPPTI